MEKIGFIGLGLMGLPMCRGCRRPASRSLSGTARRTSWSSPRRRQQTTSPRWLAAASDILMLCIADAAAVQSVVAQLQPALRAGQLIMTCPASTRTPPAAARAGQQQGASWVDAPVSGGVKGAEQGTLVIMAGGSQRTSAGPACPCKPCRALPAWAMSAAGR
jgi:3-hydroxyisobutyrate dehydrogenase